MSALAAALVYALVSVALAGAVLACGVALALACAPHLPPRLRYLAAVAAAAASLALPPVLGVARDPAPAAARAPAAGTARLTAAAGPTSGQPADGAVAGGLSAVWERVAELPAGAASGPAALWVALVWLAGAAALLAGELRAHLRLHARRRRWRPASAEFRGRAGWGSPVPLYVDAEDGPFAVGLLRPAVVLPEWLDAADAAPAARHELDHARWRDPLVHALLRATRAALWPCPHLWYLERVAHAEREAAADRAAAAHRAPGGDPHTAAAAYASLLLKVAARGNGARAPLSAVHHAAGSLERRIVRLLRQPAGASLRGGVPAALALAAGVACAAAVVPPRRSFAAPAAESRPEAAAVPGASAAAAAARPVNLAFQNLPGTPLEIVSASAVEVAGGAERRIRDPRMELVNRGEERVTQFTVAFLARGRMTAALTDTTDIAPGASYALRLPLLPGEAEAGTIHAPAAEILVAVLQARTGSGGAWGTETTPGVMPSVPPALAERVRRGSPPSPP